MRTSSSSRVTLSIALAVAASASACVTPSPVAPAPVPLGSGVYSAGIVGPTGPGNESYQRAIRFCFDQGRQLLRVDGTGAAVPLHAGGEVFFRCVGPGEPGWKEPVG